MLRTAAFSLLVTFSCEKISETTRPNAQEHNDSIKKIGRYYDDKGKAFMDNNQLDSALQNDIIALRYYEQSDEIKNKR